jgi:hypothetical protein
VSGVRYLPSLLALAKRRSIDVGLSLCSVLLWEVGNRHRVLPRVQNHGLQLIARLAWPPVAAANRVEFQDQNPLH